MLDNQPAVTDWISSISSLASTLAVIAGGAIAWRQLENWRKQAQAERRVRVAEQILTAAFEIGDVMQAARHPLSSIPAEQAKNPKYLYEKKASFIHENLAHFENLRRGQIHARILVFDNKVQDAIKNIFKVRAEYWNALQLLADYAGEKITDPSEREMLKDARRKAFYNPSKDELGILMNDSITTLETLLSDTIRQNG